MTSPKQVRVTTLKSMKARGEKITMLTAYDATMAGWMDRAGIDVLLVGDSLGMVVLGHATTVPVTLDEMLHHTRAVVRGTRRALVVADMPFLTYQVTPEDAIRNAGRLIQEGGASAVKIEGGRAIAEVARRLVDIGIPVIGHLGLTPQAVHQLGGFRAQAKTPAEAEKLLADAALLVEAGVSAIVLESIPSELARQVTATVAVPTIGIGAGPWCDGQVLVSYDAFGLYDGSVPPFVKQYAKLGEQMGRAAEEYVHEVRTGVFPAAEVVPEP